MSRSSRRQLPCGVAPFKDDLAKTKKRLAEVKAGKDAAAVKAARPELNNGWLLRPPAGAQPAASTVIAAAVPQVVLITETPAPGGGGRGGGMQIFIKTVTGKTTTLDVACCDTIKIVKQMIQAKEGIPADHLRLTYRCKQLEDDRTLADYNVDAQATLGLFTRNGSLNVLARRAELEQLRRLAELSQAEAKAAQPTAPPDVAQPAASTVDVRTGRAKGIADARATLARRMRRADRLCLAARTDAVNRSEADVVRKKAKSIKSAIHPWIHHDFVLESIGIDALYNEMREKARELQVVAVVASTSRTHTADAFAVGGTAATVCLEGIPSNAYAATVGMLREFVGSADRRHKLRDLAPDWAQPMPVPDGDHKHVLEQLDPGSREYMDIDDKFHNQGTRPFWPGTGAIERIDRVLNDVLWRKYATRRREIKAYNCPPSPPVGGLSANETILFHGTSETEPLVICDDGIDFRYGNDGMWGRAAYTAVNATYSNTYAYTRADGAKQMFAVSVALGNAEPRASNRDIRKPSRGFQSVQGQTRGSQVHMTYELYQVYPKYLITYR